MPSPLDPPGKVCVGMIAGAHGVRGLVRLRSFTDAPADVTAYGAPSDASGRRHYGITLLSPHKDHWLARIDGVGDRDAAEALRGTRLYVDRSALPEPAEDEFYHADLIGLAVSLTDGTPFGTVRAVHDFGAGELLDVERPDRSSVMIPFTREAVPLVDLGRGLLEVAPPDGLIERTRGRSGAKPHRAEELSS